MAIFPEDEVFALAFSRAFFDNALVVIIDTLDSSIKLDRCDAHVGEAAVSAVDA